MLNFNCCFFFYSCWIYNGTQHIEGPVLISEKFKDFDSSVERIDAAFVWGANGKTYLFSGDNYWRYNEALGKVDMGYPTKINDHWNGVPTHLNSAMTWINGRTYFFKGNGFWIFNNLDIKTTQVEPMMTNAYWMKCRTDSGSMKLSKNIFVLLVSLMLASIVSHVL